MVKIMDMAHIFGQMDLGFLVNSRMIQYMVKAYWCFLKLMERVSEAMKDYGLIMES
jgi:hypothetical protein